MVIYQYEDYKKVVLDWVKSCPRGGHGQFRKMSQALSVSSVFITQVLRGDRDFSADQALAAAMFMGLNPKETEYFLVLAQEARAGTQPLKNWARQKRKELKAEALELKKQIAQDTELSHEAKSVFYGHWHYSAIRLLTSIPGFETAGAIADHFHIPVKRVQEVLSFLSQHQLIMPTKKGWGDGSENHSLRGGFSIYYFSTSTMAQQGLRGHGQSIAGRFFLHKSDVTR